MLNKAIKGGLFVAGVSLVMACATAQANNEKADTADSAPVTDVQGKTADQQSNANKDLELTRLIRQGIVADDSLSTNAQNVKIITENGRVTLKGLVNSAAEKTKVESIAKSKAASASIDNQLEITQ